MATGFKRLKIDGWRQFSSIEIEMHPRLTIITGANGAGKSTLLSFLTRHFGYNRAFLGVPKTSRGITKFSNGLFEWARKIPWFSRISSPADSPQIGEIEYSDGSKTELRIPMQQGLHYSIQLTNQQEVPGIHIDSHRPPNNYRLLDQIPSSPPEINGIGNSLNSEYVSYFNGVQYVQGTLYHIKKTLIQMSIFGHGNQTMEPVPELLKLYNGFEQKLREILPKSLGFQKLTIRAPEILFTTHTGDFLIDSASGGVIKLFEIAWQIFFFSNSLPSDSSFVVTFDEPENHLHPSMQKSFLPNMTKAFPLAQIVVVTHSPFIISAMRDSSVYVLRYEDTEVLGQEYDDESIKGLMGSKVFAEKLDTVNKAGTASEILRDVLGITTTIPDWAEDRLTEIVSSYKGQTLTGDSLKELHSRLENEGLISSYPTALSELTRSN